MPNTEDKPDILEMSDEDFLNIPASSFDPKPVVEEESNNADGDSNEPDEDIDNVDTGDASEADEDTSEDVQLDSGGKDGTTNNKDTVKDNSVSPGTDGDTTDKPDVKDTGSMTDEQYAAIGKQISAEFTANGKPMKIKSAEDAIQLMQMGANYHKKMAGLKPSLKTLKLLENNDLLDPEKLNYLIDLSQKKPEAIKQLLRDSKIDPMDIDMDDETKYVPNKRTVTDTEMVLDEVLESISASPKYNQTLTVLGDEWDQSSRDTIGQNPEIIRTINAHMENGIYEQVSSQIEYERSLGKLVGISDLEAYRRVGTYMDENKLFKPAVGSNPGMQNQINNQQPQNSNTTNQDQERINRKKAASPSRQKTAPVNSDKNFNPLQMSDEEFIKLTNMSI